MKLERRTDVTPAGSSATTSSMTVTFDASRFRDRLGEPTLQRAVAAVVRRRVPAGEVEDVAQTVLCDALGSAEGAPSDAAALRRWLVGIARHKVADFHRRDGRAAPLDDEPIAPPAPLEARELLERVAGSVQGSPRERETLEWLVREHEGEALSEIAERAGLPATAVRQRVSRLRRALRAKWLGAFALLVLAGASAAGVARDGARGEGIVAEPSGSADAQLLALLQGTWRVDPSAVRGLDPAARVEADVATIRVAGDRVVVDTPAGARVFALAIHARDGGAFDVELRASSSSGVVRGLARLDRGALEVALSGDARGAAARFERVR